MALTVSMPQLGESVTEGTIARWLKQPGEPVARYESIAEVASDKVNAEIPAPADGTFGEIIAVEGSVVSVGQPICTIEQGAGAAADDANGAAHQHVTPAVRMLAREQDVDLSLIQGSGIGGRGSCGRDGGSGGCRRYCDRGRRGLPNGRHRFKGSRPDGGCRLLRHGCRRGG